jgi:tripartite-type tricarboxylate transporter receptor subunit TctC
MRLRTVAIAMALLVTAAEAHAQTAGASWPARVVTLVVPNPAGSSNDIIARLVGRELSARIGQPVIIENRPGADGTIGVRQVVRAAPDGYTLSFGSSTAYAGVPYLYLNPPYDPLKDLAPVSIVGRSPYVFAVSPALGVKSVTELVALAKARPGQLNYSSIGEGSIAQLGMADFGEKMGIELQHIPYKSTAQSIVDVSTGIIQMQLATVAPTLPMFDAKKIQVLGIAGKNRLPVFPGVPTMAEAGIPGYEHTFWVALFAPAGTPEAIIARLNREVADALATDSVKQAFNAQGVETEHSGAAGLHQILQQDIENYRTIAAKAGIPRR